MRVAVAVVLLRHAMHHHLNVDDLAMVCIAKDFTANPENVDSPILRTIQRNKQNKTKKHPLGLSYTPCQPTQVMSAKTKNTIKKVALVHQYFFI